MKFHLVSIFMLVSFVFPQDCSWWQTYVEDVPESVDFEENDDNCFSTNDLEKLQEIIELNASLSNYSPLEIGNQAWENHQITYLNLYNSGLDTIPESISEMTKLRYLYLSANPLQYIPETINELDQLERFYIHNCQIQEIPESIGELSHLKRIWIYNNQLTSIPESIGNLEELEILKIANNDLDSLPDSFGNLENLEELDALNNNLSVLPDNFGNLTNLNYLNLFNNELDEFIENLSDFESLEVLNLENNSLDSFSVEICDIYENMTYLSLGNNDICPPYPECLSDFDIGLQNMENCNFCDEGYTWIVEIPGNVQNNNGDGCYYQGDLTVLDEIAQFNNIQNEPPFYGFTQVVWQNSRISSLNLSYNSLVGLPNEIQDLEYLTHLDLSNNQMFYLNGAVSNIVNLEELNLINNPLLELPSTIGDMINLESFSVNSANLDSLPESFTNLDSLKFVFINSTEIKSIPDGIISNQNLIELNLAENQLESLPVNLCNLPEFSIINVSNNNLCNEYNFECITYWGSQNCLSIDSQVLEKNFEIVNIYPNPFNSMALIKYRVPKKGNVTILVYNLVGEKVGELLNEMQSEGYYKMEWNATQLAAGVYLLYFELLKENSEIHHQIHKVILLK